MSERSKPQTSSLFIVSVESKDYSFFNDFKFTKFSGIKDETRTFTYVSPFLHREYNIPTHRSYAPITLELPYNGSAHHQILTAWNNYQNTPLNITIEPVKCGTIDNEEVSLGYVHSLSGCIWIKCDTVEINREDNKVINLKLDFTVAIAEDKKI